MEDQNYTATQSLNSPQTEPTMSPAMLEPQRTADTDTVPIVIGAVGGKSGADGSEVGKRRRGRPRKNDVNGNMQISLAAMSASGFSTSPFGSSGKRGRGRPRGSGKLQLLASMGGILSDTAGGNFTPHVLTVNTGEDVVARILSFSQRGPRAVCILSATGAVANAIIRQSGSSGGILRYEGRFEILSLSGSYTSGGTGGSAHRKSLIMSVSLAKPDGRVFGGGVEGPLVAAGPIQLIVGSFKQNISNEIKRRLSLAPSSAANMPGDSDSARLLQDPKMIESEQNFPSPTSGFMPTTNGLPDHVMPGTPNGLLNNVTSATTNGIPDSYFPVNHQNMHSLSLSNVSLDSQVLPPMSDQMTFGDLNNGVPHL